MARKGFIGSLGNAIGRNDEFEGFMAAVNHFDLEQLHGLQHDEDQLLQ